MPEGSHGSQSSGLRRQVRSRPRVLIAEDDDDTREIYTWCLRAAGWLVQEVANGKEALSLAPDFAPDVIVMDVRLPVIGGLEATRRLKADPLTRHIPVVLCSGVDRRHAEPLAKQAGCEEFVAKPCTPDELRALLEDVAFGRRSSSA